MILDLTNFNPIEGLLEEPIVSLVTAVQKLQAKDPTLAKINLLDRAKLALMFAKGLKSDKMTVDEAAAIHLYTQQSEIYKQLNLRLRERERGPLKAFFPYLKLLLTGLYKLRLINVSLFRGVKLNLSEMFINKKTEEIFWWAFSSASASMEVLKDPQFLGVSGPRTMFCLTAPSVDIREFSAYPQEDERLILPGTCLIVDGVLDLGGGLCTVQLREAKDNPSGLIDFPHPGLLVCINLHYLSIFCVMFLQFSPYFFSISPPKSHSIVTAAFIPVF